MFFFASANAVSTSLSETSSFLRARPGQQDFLDNEIVEQAELGGERLLLGQRRRLAHHPPERFFHLIALDLLAVDHGPRIGRYRRRGGR